MPRFGVTKPFDGLRSAAWPAGRRWNGVPADRIEQVTSGFPCEIIATLLAWRGYRGGLAEVRTGPADIAETRGCSSSCTIWA
ncbi:hypothetical protein Alo02nite_83060 [Actinoplanes lobatus]|uniref:Uncharacterized protein n=1 Tax=Actinoplanes lobatus TaxID=113568 RepID=A0ABQ4AWN6_9ACTN|nr:hypothetical protein Alo02nite_83060 [Actinoplanes lobatus]